MRPKQYRKDERVFLGRSGYYYAVYYVDNIRFYESTRQQNVVKAAEKLKELKYLRETGVVPLKRQKSTRLPELFGEFINWYEYTKKRSPFSVRRHRVASKPVLDYFKKIRVKLIMVQSIERYITNREKQGVAPNTIRKEISLLSAMLGYAARTSIGYIRRNPVPEVENKPSPRAVNPPFSLSQEEIDRVLSVLGNRVHRLFFLLLLHTGMRVSEAIRLVWEDIKFEVGNGIGEIVVRKAKRHKWRRIPIFEELRKELLAVPERKRTGPVLKHVRKKGYKRGIYNVLNRVLKETGVRRFSHHTLRHTFISRCYEAGISDLVIASWTGHSVQVMRDIYLHLPGSDFQETQKLVKFSRKGF